MEGKMTDGTTYTFTLNGKDIKEEKEINIELKRTSPYDDEIKQLSEHPVVLYFEQSGTFPGVIQVEVPVEKEDGEYLLLYYNSKEQKAEYVQKVEVKDGQTKFLIEKGGAYFIDKRASTKSLKDDTKEKDNFIDTDTDEIILQGTKDEILVCAIYWRGAHCMRSGCIGTWIFVHSKKETQKGQRW